MEDLEQIRCNFCGESKPKDQFTKNRSIKRGCNLECKVCKNKKQKTYRDTGNNINTKMYEKTKKGYLVRTYRNMKSRVSGVLKKKSHLYEGLNILDKEVFYKWALDDATFNELFDNWVSDGYDRKLSPSIDRIDSTRGYDEDNIQWLTHSENSKKIKRK